MGNDMKGRRDRFRRRKNVLFKKAHELGKLCGADVAVIVYESGRFYTYRSTDRKTWPPPVEQIEITYPLPELMLSEDLERRSSKPKVQRFRSRDPKEFYKMGLVLAKNPIDMDEEVMSTTEPASEQDSMNTGEEVVNVECQNKVLNSDLKLKGEQCYLMQLMAAAGSELVTEEAQKK